MGVRINNNDMTVPGTLTAGTVSAAIIRVAAPSFAGFSWTPAYSLATSINSVPFPFPLAVVRLSFGTIEIQDLNVSGISLTDLDVSELNALAGLNASGNDFVESVVDAILLALANGPISNGTVDLSGGTSATPSAAGLISKATLEGRGWTVTVN